MHPAIRTVLIGGLLMALAAEGTAKYCQTYYTPARITAGRENIQKYGWAQSRLRAIMKGQSRSYIIGHDFVSAEEYAAQSDDFMWALQPSTLIPRAAPIETQAVCPIHGTEVRKVNGFHPWRIDPINHPYKVQCPIGKEWYPSNDYAAGDMTGGEYPDDGGGILHQGKRYYMLREYAHACYCSITIPCLRALSQAWLLTGDRLYAHKCAILLAGLASEYPNHDDRKHRLYLAPYGGTHPHYTWKHGGMITDLIWETFSTEGAVLAYDAIYNYIGRDPELIEFLKDKGMPIENADDLREYIEHYILRAAATGLLNGAIHGNEGHHQALAMTIALVLDDYSDNHPNSLDMIDYTYHGEGRAAYMLINGLHRDGGGNESPNYNRIKLDFIRVARLMESARELHPELLPPDTYPDIFGSAKAASIFDYFINMQVLDHYLPSIGDCGGIRAPRRVSPRAYSILTGQNVFAFEQYGLPRHARAATDLKDVFHRGEMFEPYPADEIKRALESPDSLIKREPRLLDDYGAAILESGAGENRRAVVLNYAATMGHRQQDNLNLEVFARGLKILPDLGYPFTWSYRENWDSNIMAHNTVSVGETWADNRIRVGNDASLFASQDGVHVITAHHDPYPQGAGACKASAREVDLYERTVILIDVDEERFYVVDLFAVNGGEQRDQSWHGPPTAVEAPDLDWETQQTGTLAGPGVEQFAKYTDRWGRTWDNFPAFVKDIRRAMLDRPAVWSWDYTLPEGDRLNLHLIPVGDPMQIIMGTGRSPARPDDWGLDYVFARRMAPNPERSLFLTVIDAYQEQPVVRQVRLVSQDPLQLEVTRDDGKDIIDLATPAGPSRTTAHRDHGLRVRSFTHEAITRDVRIGAWSKDQEPGYHLTAIDAVDHEGNRIGLPYEQGMERDFAPGRAVRVFNDRRSAMFRIVRANREAERLWLTLDVSALVARGPVTDIGDGSLSVGAHFTFATGGVGDDGRLVGTSHLAFAGSVLGEGATARRVKGAARTGPSASKVFLDDPVPQADLLRDYGSRVISVWQYGVGDSVELARVHSAES